MNQVVSRIPFELFLPIKYFLILQMQTIGCFLKDVQSFVN